MTEMSRGSVIDGPSVVPGSGRDRADEFHGVPDSVPPIDYRSLVHRCLDNVPFARSLLADLQVGGEQRVNAISRHVENADLAVVMELAHSLRGSAGIMSAGILRKVAAEIEDASLAGDLVCVAKLVPQLRDEMNRCVSYIPRIFAELDSPSSEQVNERPFRQDAN